MIIHCVFTTGIRATPQTAHGSSHQLYLFKLCYHLLSQRLLYHLAGCLNPLRLHTARSHLILSSCDGQDRLSVGVGHNLYDGRKRSYSPRTWPFLADQKAPRISSAERGNNSLQDTTIAIVDWIRRAVDFCSKITICLSIYLRILQKFLSFNLIFCHFLSNFYYQGKAFTSVFVLDTINLDTSIDWAI